MPEELAPPVVAVVVASDPGDWFEYCLESLCRQDYPNLALLVVDDGSASDLTSRVAAVEPAAIVRRRSERGGYSLAANEALHGVEGATFFLFCHDDVELEPSALRTLVSESFRTNAAIVGPKLVDAGAPERLRQVGLGMHRLGTPAPRVRPGELDQSQHDEAREVFAVPGGCTLIRADLFEALHGYDPAIPMFGEDVDFCWRAQIAGARVTVAPGARVGHREAESTGARLVADPELLRRRHELRAVLKNYGFFHRCLAFVELLVVGLGEVVLAMTSGERERSRRLWRAWRWNFSERQSLRSERRHLREIRQLRDRVLVARMTSRSRLRRYLRPEPSESPGTGRPSDEPEGQKAGTWWGRVRDGQVPAGEITLAVAVVLVGLAGLRDVLFARLPLVGQFVAMPNGSGMLAQYFGGLDTGTGTHAAPTAYGLVGLLGLVLADSTATAWKLVAVGSLVAGAVGVSRLCKPFASSRGRLIASTAFLGLALGWNSIATGNVAAAVTLGAAPYVLARIGRATGLSPYAAAHDGARRTHGLVGEIVPFGLLLAVQSALAPAGLLGLGALLVAVIAACLATGRARAAGRTLLVSAGALAVAFCCCLPWSASWLAHGAEWSAFSGVVPGAPASAASLLRGHTGPVGAWWGTWGIAVAGAYVLLVARGQRLFWATAWWLAAAGAVALAWAGSEGWLGAGAGASAVVAAPASAILAALCGLGAAAFEHDVVVRASLGWRQASAALAACCLVGGMIPALGVALGGRADLPPAGIDQTLDWTLPGAHQAYRVLWLGDPRSLPAAGWQLAPGLAWFATAHGLPRADQIWPEPSPGALDRVPRAIRAAEAGRTVNVGAMLGPVGVRYLVLPVADAPQLSGTQNPPLVAAPPPQLLATLRAQDDLIERPVEAGALVFVNADWSAREGAGAAALAPRGGATNGAGGRDAGLALGVLTFAAAIGEGLVRRRRWDRDPRTSARVLAVGAAVR
jgi:GT2 family glycosyltransferase